jgi:predicted lipoprotein with Yx(FWY)xxD motif
MKTKLSLLSILVVAALVLAACSSSNNGTPQAYQPAVGAKNTPIIPVTGGAAEVDLGKADSLGSFLVDAKGMTLYLYTKDSPNKTVCYDKCAQAWPPLLTGAAPTAGTGVDSAKLGTIQRTDGTTQVTYNGWPLYYYISDAKTGDITGQDVGSVWFVVSAVGDLVKASLPVATIAPTEMAPIAAVSGRKRHDPLPLYHGHLQYIGLLQPVRHQLAAPAGNG